MQVQLLKGNPCRDDPAWKERWHFVPYDSHRIVKEAARALSKSGSLCSIELKQNHECKLFDLKSGDVLWLSWVGFHYGLWGLKWFSRISLKKPDHIAILLTAFLYELKNKNCFVVKKCSWKQPFNGHFKVFLIEILWVRILMLPFLKRNFQFFFSP